MPSTAAPDVTSAAWSSRVPSTWTGRCRHRTRDSRDEQRHASLRVDYDLNDVWQLTYIAGYGARDETEIYDGDYLPTSFQVSNFTPSGFPFGGFADGPPFLYGYVGGMTDFTVASDNAADNMSA